MHSSLCHIHICILCIPILQLCGLLADRLETCPDALKPGEIANILFGRGI